MSGNIATEVDWSWVKDFREGGEPGYVHDVMIEHRVGLVLYLGRLSMDAFEELIRRKERRDYPGHHEVEEKVYPVEVYATIGPDGTELRAVASPMESVSLGNLKDLRLQPMPDLVLRVARMIYTGEINPGGEIYVGPSTGAYYKAVPAPTGLFSCLERKKLERGGFEKVGVYAARPIVRDGSRPVDSQVVIVHNGMKYTLPHPDALRRIISSRLHDLASDMQYEAKAPYA